MTKEPIYECTQCGTTLDRDEQGVFTWCPRCRAIWEDGFREGVKAHRDIVSVCDGNDILRLMEARCIYKVRE